MLTSPIVSCILVRTGCTGRREGYKSNKSMERMGFFLCSLSTLIFSNVFLRQTDRQTDRPCSFWPSHEVFTSPPSSPLETRSPGHHIFLGADADSEPATCVSPLRPFKLSPSSAPTHTTHGRMETNCTFCHPTFCCCAANFLVKVRTAWRSCDWSI